jgi:hypothetical protein
MEQHGQDADRRDEHEEEQTQEKLHPTSPVFRWDPRERAEPAGGTRALPPGDGGEPHRPTGVIRPLE